VALVKIAFLALRGRDSDAAEAGLRSAHMPDPTARNRACHVQVSRELLENSALEPRGVRTRRYGLTITLSASRSFIAR